RTPIAARNAILPNVAPSLSASQSPIVRSITNRPAQINSSVRTSSLARKVIARNPTPATTSATNHMRAGRGDRIASRFGLNSIRLLQCLAKARRIRTPLVEQRRNRLTNLHEEFPKPDFHGLQQWSDAAIHVGDKQRDQRERHAEHPSFVSPARRL